MRKMMKNYLNSLSSGPIELSNRKSHSLPSELEESSRAVHWVNQAWRTLEIRGVHKWMCYRQPLPLTPLGRARRE